MYHWTRKSPWSFGSHTDSGRNLPEVYSLRVLLLLLLMTALNIAFVSQCVVFYDFLSFVMQNVQTDKNLTTNKNNGNVIVWNSCLQLTVHSLTRRLPVCLLATSRKSYTHWIYIKSLLMMDKKVPVKFRKSSRFILPEIYDIAFVSSFVVFYDFFSFVMQNVQTVVRDKNLSKR